ncbi:MAG: hypothetical protein B7Z22_12880 [Hyphomonas sp. 32-62-5]|nr:MAG: hypothetical protein B7Z22_12880 [Hyphomonas sp. 32-62-5]
MADATRPISIRLPEADHVRLAEHATRLSGTPSALARELIRSGPTDRQVQSVGHIETMFHQLLRALAGETVNEETRHVSR